VLAQVSARPSELRWASVTPEDGLEPLLVKQVETRPGPLMRHRKLTHAPCALQAESWRLAGASSWVELGLWQPKG
jgi:hypothetical protein